MKRASDVLFDATKAFAHLEHLAVKIGPRLTGSAGEHAAARYIEKHFRTCGLAARLQRFPVTTFENRACTFEVRDGSRWRKVACEPVMLSTSTPPRGIDAEIYFARTGQEECFSPDMKGRIVLVFGGVGKAARPKFLSYGPKALVIIEGRDGPEPLHKALDFTEGAEYGNLPMARIPYRDGLDIVKRGLGRGRLAMLNSEKKSHSFNVIGEKRGSDRPDEIVVVCGHYDSCMGITGAADNAGGTAIMMELARALGSEESRRTLRFVAFAAEETGLHGSTYYADSLAEADAKERKRKSFNENVDLTERDRHRLTFNIDVHGYVLGRNEAWFTGPEDVGASLRLLAKENGFVMGVKKAAMSSDGTPLAAVGTPNVQLARWSGGGTGHTTLDHVRDLWPEALGESGAFAERWLRRYVTGAAAFPFAREIPPEQMKDVEKYFKSHRWRVPGDLEAKTKLEKRTKRSRSRKRAR